MTKTVNINGTDVRIKALGGERVLFFSDLDRCYKLPIGTVQELFAKNKYRLTESTEYIVTYPACLTYRGFALLGKLIPDGDTLDIFSDIMHEYYFGEKDEDESLKPDMDYMERMEWGTKYLDTMTELVKLTKEFIDKDIITSGVM